MLKVNSAKITREVYHDGFIYNVSNRTNDEKVAQFTIDVLGDRGERALYITDYYIKDPTPGFHQSSKKMISSTILGSILIDAYSSTSVIFDSNPSSKIQTFDVKYIDAKDEYL